MNAPVEAGSAGASLLAAAGSATSRPSSLPPVVDLFWTESALSSQKVELGRAAIGEIAKAIHTACVVDESSKTDSGFVDLFDGKSLKGWDGDLRCWRVENGVIVGETAKGKSPEHNTFLIHRGGELGNFELRLSCQAEGFNSGVQYRSVDDGDWVVSGYQCDFEARWHFECGPDR